MATNATNHFHATLNGQTVDFEFADIGEIEIVHAQPNSTSVSLTVNRCIYCGSNASLTDEHIIPLGLSGTDILRKASCTACAKETGRFEQLVLRGPMRAARVYRKLKSRTNHADAPATQRVIFIDNEKEYSADIPIAEYPILLNFPIFAQPGCLTGKYPKGIGIEGLNTVLFGPRPEDVVKAYGAQKIRFPQTIEQPIAFARLLAKIAYGYAYAHGSLFRLSAPSSVLPCILGQSDDFGQWVFTFHLEKQKSYPGLLHRVQMREEHGFLLAEVHLFSDCQSPIFMAWSLEDSKKKPRSYIVLLRNRRRICCCVDAFISPAEATAIRLRASDSEKSKDS